ncbi:Gfo/Idh/MocA family oxidoreductase [uncultured Litoreibacter sp.]|uniref:Gfo/Idh/MocA family protein n=1 Tax=uncultured Litoreibacter sp. TaxID=1392394 RepID=UPI0026037BD5|nr:Gfo/Idh/MocA family oxidoreductase [uncultured Litoreibacter sp.]
MNAALIGTGMVADTHVLACRDSDKVALAGVCATSIASARRYADRLDAEYGLQVQAYDDVAAVADDPSVDFAIIATPPNARLDIVRALAEAGKPILMEKPLERNLEAATALVTLCDGRVPFGIVFQHRVREASIALLEKLPLLGPVQVVEITVPWWRDQSYYDAPGRGTYTQDGGGVLITQAIHTLDLALSLVGPVSSVQAFARTSASHEMEAEDFVSAGLEFANGAIGSLHASTASYPGGAEVITLHCAHASAVLGNGVLTLNWRDGRTEQVGARAATGGGADPMAFTHAWHQSIIEDFSEAVKHGRPPLVPGREALQVHALIDALTLSSKERKLIEVPHV